jgi:nucleoside-diphosphate-sugar epimerase
VIDLAAYTGDDARGVIKALGGRVGHYVLVSTGQVYLVREGCPRPARESDYEGAVMARPADGPDLPEWEYGVGKRAAEDVLTAGFVASGFPGTRLRIPMVNGELDYYRRFESYLWRLYDGGPVLIPDGGKHQTRHIYGDDVARTAVAILGRQETFGQAYNLAQEETPTLRELLETLRELTGSTAPLVDAPAAALRARGLDPATISPFSNPWMSFIDPARARAELGFRATPVHEVLARAVATFTTRPSSHAPESYAQRAEERAFAAKA